MEMNIRPRRLRTGSILRKMVRETRMDKSSLIYPMFIKEGAKIQEEIPTMPGQYRYSVDRMPFALEKLLKAGVGSVMFFGIKPSGRPKESSRISTASATYACASTPPTATAGS